MFCSDMVFGCNLAFLPFIPTLSSLWMLPWWERVWGFLVLFLGVFCLFVSLSISEHLIYLQNIKVCIKYSAVLTVRERQYMKIREQSFRHCNSLTATQSYDDLPQLRTWLTTYDNTRSLGKGDLIPFSLWSFEESCTSFLGEGRELQTILLRLAIITYANHIPLQR